MPLLVRKSTSGIRKTGQTEYEGLSDDPFFRYRFLLRRPRYLVVFLQALNDPLDPKLYADRGNGFDEANATTLKEAGAQIYSIEVLAPRHVTAIRIDPCTRAQRFRYWVKCAWSHREREAALAKARQLSGGYAGVSTIKLEGTPEKRVKRRIAIRVPQHFAAVVRSATRDAPPITDAELADGPFISLVVPMLDSPPAHLNDLLQSFQQQPAGAAELILSDDGSTAAKTLSWLAEREATPGVRIVRNSQNQGIALATNAGIGVARGQWVGLLDHDDALTPGAVQLIAQTARENPRAQFIYTDEVVTDAKLKPVDYFLKPAYDEVLLSGVNYINHLSCYRRDRLLALGALKAGYDGSQDYDLLLRYLRGLKTDEIRHLPYPAYRWRRARGTFSAQFVDRATAGARKTLAERYWSDNSQPLIDEAHTKTLHRIRFEKLKKRWPRVSIVIPSRDSFALISRVLADLTSRTDYPDFEIIVIDNGTTDARVLDLYAKAGEHGISFKAEVESAPFNFSRQVNRGIALATGELVLLLNNDIEVIDADWLREMVACFEYPDTGIVGARLLYANRRLQHAGVIVGLGGLAGHWFESQREDYPGPMARLHVRQSLTAVTGACMLISRDCLAKVGPFNDEQFAIAYNDIDFCLRAGEAGFRVVWTPFATLIHHESASRGSDKTGANWTRFERDKDNLRRRHHTDSFQDRAFSPWYTRDRSEPRLRMLDKLPPSR
jgi:O-antigen biosynthesis protein